MPRIVLNDPAKAKELLKQAGYPDGFTCNFIVPESGSGMQSPVEMATVIQANLAAVGIKCNIQTFEWGTYLQKFREGPDISEMSWNPSIGDPDQLIYMLLHSSRFPPAFNAGFYKHEKVDELLDKARTTSKETCAPNITTRPRKSSSKTHPGFSWTMGIRSSSTANA